MTHFTFTLHPLLAKSIHKKMLLGLLFFVVIQGPEVSAQTNIALGKAVKQSNTGYGGIPERAVDGNTDGDYQKNSVTSANNVNNPWWEVDLGAVYDISSIVIFNRTNDCCSKDLKGFYVMVSEDPIHENSTTENVFASPIGEVKSKYELEKTGTKGRFVRIFIPGNAKSLYLAEVQVFGKIASTIANLALFKPTKQSSTSFSGIAKYAVDGNTDGKWGKGTITATDQEANPWWEVDLGAVYDISSITLFNRTDDCCWDRLANCYIMVSENPIVQNSTQNAFTGPVEVVQKKSAYSYAKSGFKGRYVRVFKQSKSGEKDILSLAEVQVLGTQTTNPGNAIEEEIEIVNIAKDKYPESSSNYGEGAPDKAIDGNTDGRWEEKSVFHSVLENNPWWQVDLGANYDISSLKIFNRTDPCCTGDLKDYYIMVSERPIIKNNTTGAYAGPISEAQEVKEFNKSVTGRFIRIFIPGNKKKLTLAEVQVFGTPAPQSEKPKEGWEIIADRKIFLNSFDNKSSLTTDELKQVREALLDINNAARQNPDYRKVYYNGLSIDKRPNPYPALDLPSGLAKLKLDENLNRTAQNQADYCANNAHLGHDQPKNPDTKYNNPGDRYKVITGLNSPALAEAVGPGGKLAEILIRIMVSTTHYKPTWDIEYDYKTVGYGIAKGPASGNPEKTTWYLVIVWA